MKKIGAICLNPCIDMTVRAPRIERGALNRVKDVRFDYSGKGVNVAIVAARLCGEAVLTGFLGSAHRRMYEERLRSEGVESRCIVYSGEVRTNIKLYEEDAFTEINSPGQAIGQEELAALLKTVEQLSLECDMLMMSGSIPPGVSKEIYAEIIRCAAQHGTPTLLDADGEALRLGLQAGPTMIKPNLYELEQLCGRKLETKAEVVRAARAAGAELVLVSDGGNGAYLVDGSEAYYCPAPSIEVRTTTGAGDSLAVGAALAYLDGKERKEILENGVAAGSATCLSHGTELLKPENMEKLLRVVKAERIDEK